MRRYPALAAVLGATLAAAACTSGGAPRGGRPSGPASPSRHSSAAASASGSPSTPPSPAPTAATSPSPRPTRVDLVGRTWAFGAVVASVASADVLWLLERRNTTARRDRFVVARLDLRTGELRRSVPVAGGASLALAASRIWVAGGSRADEGSVDSNSLFLLDATTLRVTERVTLPAPPVEVVAHGERVWARTDRTLYRFDPRTGAQRAQVGSPYTFMSISLSPGGGSLYVVEDAQESEGPSNRVTRRHPLTGAVVVRRDEGGVVGGSVAAAAGGAWHAYPTGMLAAVEFRRASDLRDTNAYTDDEGDGAGPNSTRVALLGGVLVVRDGVRPRAVCADPATGRRRGVQPLPGQDAYFRPHGSVSFLEYDGRLRAVRTARGCR